MTDTTQKQQGGVTGKGFVKGDKRINRKGRPKSFDALRKLAQSIAAEELQSTDGDTITRIEALLRVMSTSRNPADRKTFLEYAFGKPKEEVDVTSAGKEVNPYMTMDAGALLALARKLVNANKSE